MEVEQTPMSDRTGLFNKLIEYVGKYQISFQMWGEGNYNIFIEKDDVDLTSFGGLDTPEECMRLAVEYLDRVNRKKAEPKFIECDQCDGCGWYEGGPTIKTTCRTCNGTGVMSLESLNHKQP